MWRKEEEEKGGRFRLSYKQQAGHKNIDIGRSR